MEQDAGATWAVVVARVGPTAKTRLAGVLGPAERSMLANVMLADVLQACAEVFGPRVLAVVDAPRAYEVASARGALALLDAVPTAGMNAAVARGAAFAAEQGATGTLILPGDVPLASAAALRRVLAADDEAGRAVIVVTDRAGQGTNALLLRPPGVIAPGFGAGSAARHLARAGRAGAVAKRLMEPALALDVDTPADLQVLIGARPSGATGALLAEWASPGRPAARTG